MLKSPLIPGHQVVGIVEKTGSRVDSVERGIRVGVPWLYSTCGQCDYCLLGDENLCDGARFTGYSADGGFAEYMVAPAGFIYKIPDPFTDLEAAPLLCAGIIGYRALRLCGIRPGERLGLYGFGASAHLAIQVARHWDCEVYVFSRSGDHRELARSLGAAWTGTPEMIPPHLINSAVSFAPSGEIVPHALNALRKGGTLALAGIYSSPIPSLEYRLIYHERTVRSVANSTRKDAEEFLALAAVIPVRTTTEIFPLEEVNEALRLLKTSRLNGAAVLAIRT